MPFRHQISLSCCVTYVALSRLFFGHNNQTSDLYELTCLATHINTTDANLCNFLNPDAFDSPSLNNWWTWFNGNYCESGVFGEASPIGSQNVNVHCTMSLEEAVDRECHSGPKNLTALNCPHLLWQLLSSPNIHLGAEHGNARVSVRAAANPHPTGAFLSSWPACPHLGFCVHHRRATTTIASRN